MVSGIRAPGRLSRAVFAALSETSWWLGQAREAWRRPATPLLLPAAGHALIGRSHICDVVLDGEYVSRRHAQLRETEGGWTLEDCGSRNGTWVNGCRVRAETEVRPGDVVTLADLRYVLARPRGGQASA